MKEKRTSRFMITLTVLLTAMLIFTPGASALELEMNSPSIFGVSGKKLSVDYDPETLATADNTVFDPNLAAFCSLLCADIYKDGSVILSLPEGTEYDKTALLTALGFEDVTVFNTLTDPTGSGTDTDDTITLVAGHRTAENGTELFIAVIRGTNSRYEWMSDFDTGADTAEFDALTGPHPEWRNRLEAKGPAVAADRAGNALRDYMAAHAEGRETALLLTGHSRGGCIANLLGARLEREGYTRCFSYAIFPVRITRDPDAENIRTAFCLINEDDLFYDLALREEDGWRTYGREIRFSVEGTPSLKENLIGLKDSGRCICLTREEKDTLLALWAECFPSPEDCYRMTETETVFDTAEEAEAARVQYDEAIAAIYAGRYCKTELRETEGRFTLTLSACPTALRNAVALTMGYRSDTFAPQVRLLFGEQSCRIIYVLLDGMEGLFDPHLLVNAYAAMTNYTANENERNGSHE